MIVIYTTLLNCMNLNENKDLPIGHLFRTI